ncbi:hypothetical protein ACO0RG_002438 [Hanseniaspora osmophila]|uniref:U6 snRNA-associated Sm-like protein LSm5 n=1 Tax=Hanseniaspora osmophila TaxID=56408 RepID=A0A1E5RVJ0_9ASCO|nr:U6 snRNA-associated Sm-like protein LSm5 [Hanseniaspora osmophila]
MSTNEEAAKQVLLPMELIDRSINEHVLVITTGGREYYGVLKGYDDFVNVVLQDGIEIKHETTAHGAQLQESLGEVVNKYGKEMLVSGQNIVMIVPGQRDYV